MFSRIKEKAIRLISLSAFKYLAKKAVIRTSQNSNLTILSAIGKDTFDMYLIALSTFTYNCVGAKIAVLDDGSLTENQINRLRNLISGVIIKNANDIDTSGCPSYISWKRLFWACELSQENYVIQLDSDTITFNAVTKIIELFNLNRAFVIGSSEWADPIDLKSLSQLITHRNIDHVQTNTEVIFHKLGSIDQSRPYLRGCAAVTGFPKGYLNRAKIVETSNEIESYISKAWHGWGSEQTMTLLMLSQSKESQILPWPYYQNYLFPKANISNDATQLIHYIGSNRYKDFSYLLAAIKEISRLGIRQ